MRKNKTFTSSISPVLIAKVNLYARRYNMTKNKVIELALTRLFETATKAELSLSFKAAKRDKKMRSFSKHAAGDLQAGLRRKK
jgi:hypothetical protein